MAASLGLTQQQVDRDIIDQVLPIVKPQLTNAQVSEIDIYQPNGCTGTTPFVSGTCPPNNGAYYTAGEPIDVYSVTNYSRFVPLHDVQLHARAALADASE